jgi:heme-degrading monooxygenase HmoA
MVPASDFTPQKSIVRINAIEVPPERADEMARRFAARAGEVEKADGFEEFQLLRPTDDRTTWLVYTRWRDEASFTAWAESRAFQQGHAQREPGAAPVATGSELWSFLVEQRELAPAG